MDGEWALIEFRPGRYVKVLPDGTVLGRATEAEVRSWFATLGWDLEARPAEPPQAPEAVPVDSPDDQEQVEAAPQGSEAPPLATKVPVPAPEPDELELTRMASPAADEPPAPPKTPLEAPTTGIGRVPAESPEQLDVLPATQLAYDLLPSQPTPEPGETDTEEPVTARLEPVTAGPQDATLATVGQGFDEAPLPETEEPLADTRGDETVAPVLPAPELPDRTAGAPDRAVWSIEPRASRARVAVRRPSPPLAELSEEDDLELEDEYGAPTAGAADWWLWVDPRQESDYTSATFDLRAFLARAMDRFQEKPWARGLRPARLAFHPGSAPDGMDAAAGELGLDLIADSKVAPGTFMLGASDSD
jgi:hypothetical protein